MKSLTLLVFLLSLMGSGLAQELTSTGRFATYTTSECQPEMHLMIAEGNVADCRNDHWVKTPCDDLARPKLTQLQPYPDWRMAPDHVPLPAMFVYAGGYPEPLFPDVPAIQESHHNPAYDYPCGGSSGTFSVCIQAPEQHLVWTCADKKRILMESVDGTVKVCHKAGE